MLIFVSISCHLTAINYILFFFTLKTIDWLEWTKDLFHRGNHSSEKCEMVWITRKLNEKKLAIPNKLIIQMARGENWRNHADKYEIAFLILEIPLIHCTAREKKKHNSLLKSHLFFPNSDTFLLYYYCITTTRTILNRITFISITEIMT